MSISECDRLDDYLLGGLPEEERAGFEAHLEGCPVCRDELRQQRNIDRLLAQGTGQIEPVPSSLIGRIERQYRRLDRRRAVRMAWALSAAAVVLVVLVAWLATGGLGTGNRLPPVVQERPDPVPDTDQDSPDEDHPPRAQPVVRVTVADPSAAILVPLETKAPNVSIVWIYPTVGPAQRPEEPRDD